MSKSTVPQQRSVSHPWLSGSEFWISRSKECIARGNDLTERWQDLDRRSEAVMRRSNMLSLIGTALNNAVKCARHIKRQRDLIADWEQRGYDTTLAKTVLATLNQNLLLHHKHCEWTAHEVQGATREAKYRVVFAMPKKDALTDGGYVSHSPPAPA